MSRLLAYGLKTGIYELANHGPSLQAPQGALSACSRNIHVSEYACFSLGMKYWEHQNEGPSVKDYEVLAPQIVSSSCSVC